MYPPSLALYRASASDMCRKVNAIFSFSQIFLEIFLTFLTNGTVFWSKNGGDRRVYGTEAFLPPTEAATAANPDGKDVGPEKRWWDTGFL